ncbi:LptA/OstA family protein [uncultured Nitratireductor sp.]|uniref:LptA/OstA family protein n=1 Tax=uncultured Nitratireductor sp. TaxID=520953 RepID=UPI0025CCDF38|nr:LptA/OstA family protein [uncultured Nitratireductor sp.]
MYRTVFSVVSVLFLASPVLAANEAPRFDRFEVNADSIEVDDDNIMHASGNVVLTDENTEIHMDRATISVKDGRTIIEAASEREDTSK